MSYVAWSILAKEWFRQPFNIRQKCALRACLLAIESERQVLLLNIHHALIYGESINILLCDLSHCDAALQHNQQLATRVYATKLLNVTPYSSIKSLLSAG